VLATFTAHGSSHIVIHNSGTLANSLSLGDGRLDKRAKILMERFAANPTASIPMACHSWAETCAAYRFLGNPDVDWRDMMAPRWEQTQKRMQIYPVVLCLTDSTELDFNGQEAAGLGPLNYEARRGMYLHPTYAVTPQREPLGVLDAWMWARELREIAQGTPATLGAQGRDIERKGRDHQRHLHRGT
jgi:hypothetical protein